MALFDHLKQTEVNIAHPTRVFRITHTCPEHGVEEAEVPVEIIDTIGKSLGESIQMSEMVAKLRGQNPDVVRAAFMLTCAVFVDAARQAFTNFDAVAREVNDYIDSRETAADLNPTQQPAKA